MENLIAIAGIGVSGIIAILLTLVGVFSNSKLKDLSTKMDDIDKWNKADHIELKLNGEKTQKSIDHLIEHFDAEKIIVRIATEAKEFVHSNDIPMHLFIKTCVDASLYFYNEITTKNLKNVTKADIDKCSDTAIMTMRKARDKFEPEFVDEFWLIFVQKAMDVRIKFDEIFADEFNQKHDRFVREISTYLFDQLKTIIKLRYK